MFRLANANDISRVSPLLFLSSILQWRIVYRKHAHLSTRSYSVFAVCERYGVHTSINLRNRQARQSWYDQVEDVPSQEPWTRHL
jgi:endo-1,4-beta-mannosidase